jgi:hypothetical protein
MHNVETACATGIDERMEYVRFSSFQRSAMPFSDGIDAPTSLPANIREPRCETSAGAARLGGGHVCVSKTKPVGKTGPGVLGVGLGFGRMLGWHLSAQSGLHGSDRVCRTIPPTSRWHATDAPPRRNVGGGPVPRGSRRTICRGAPPQNQPARPPPSQALIVHGETSIDPRAVRLLDPPSSYPRPPSCRKTRIAH